MDFLVFSCINMSVNVSIMGLDEVKILFFYVCLNKEFVFWMVCFLVNYLFLDIGSFK